MKTIKENYNKEEWGGWKIVSDMLDKPDKNGIYPTSECYQKLYDFVCEQKKKAVKEYKKSPTNQELVIWFAEYAYKRANPKTKMDTPSIVYEQIEKDFKKFLTNQ